MQWVALRLPPRRWQGGEGGRESGGMVCVFVCVCVELIIGPAALSSKTGPRSAPTHPRPGPSALVAGRLAQCGPCVAACVTVLSGEQQRK